MPWMSPEFNDEKLKHQEIVNEEDKSRIPILKRLRIILNTFRRFRSRSVSRNEAITPENEEQTNRGTWPRRDERSLTGIWPESDDNQNNDEIIQWGKTKVETSGQHWEHYFNKDKDSESQTKQNFKSSIEVHTDDTQQPVIQVKTQTPAIHVPDSSNLLHQPNQDAENLRLEMKRAWRSHSIHDRVDSRLRRQLLESAHRLRQDHLFPELLEMIALTRFQEEQLIRNNKEIRRFRISWKNDILPRLVWTPQASTCPCCHQILSSSTPIPPVIRLTSDKPKQPLLPIFQKSHHTLKPSSPVKPFASTATQTDDTGTPGESKGSVGYEELDTNSEGKFLKCPSNTPRDQINIAEMDFIIDPHMTGIEEATTKQPQPEETSNNFVDIESVLHQQQHKLSNHTLKSSSNVKLFASISTQTSHNSIPGESTRSDFYDETDTNTEGNFLKCPSNTPREQFNIDEMDLFINPNITRIKEYTPKQTEETSKNFVVIETRNIQELSDESQDSTKYVTIKEQFQEKSSVKTDVAEEYVFKENQIQVCKICEEILSDYQDLSIEPVSLTVPHDSQEPQTTPNEIKRSFPSDTKLFHLPNEIEDVADEDDQSINNTESTNTSVIKEIQNEEEINTYSSDVPSTSKPKSNTPRTDDKIEPEILPPFLSTCTTWVSEHMSIPCTDSDFDTLSGIQSPPQPQVTQRKLLPNTEPSQVTQRKISPNTEPPKQYSRKKQVQELIKTKQID